jgi:hypothetical protein
MIAPIYNDEIFNGDSSGIDRAPNYTSGGGGSSTITLVRGCTNPRASNYNSRATIDDGSCILVTNPIEAIDVVEVPIAVDNMVYVTCTSNPTNAAITINRIETGYNTASTLTFNAKELLKARIFGVKRSGFASVEQYKLIARYTVGSSGIATYPIEISKLINGVWSEYSAVSVTALLTNISLNFTLSGNEIIPPDTGPDVIIPETSTTNTYQVEIDGNVSSNNIIKYTTSDGVTGFVQNDTPNIFNVSTNNTSGVPWIQFEKYGITNYTHNVSYKIFNPNSGTPIDIVDDFKKELIRGVTRIAVVADKLNLDIDTNVPTIIVESDNFEFNIAGGLSLDIPYSSLNAQSVSYTLGTTQRILEPNGKIVLTPADFSNGIGQYTLYLQPISTQLGSGALKQIHLNVVSKVYLPGPDITKINYPYNIKGADFKGYEEEFQISWQSINTNYIEIYVSKAETEFLLSRGAPQGAAKFIVSEVLTRAKKTFNDSTDVLSFDLILVPFNQEGDTLEKGKEEKITIIFDKGDLKLRRAQVLTDLKIAFQQQFDKTIFEPETSRYLTHYSHFGNGDNKLIATWGIDTDTFSTFVEDIETSQLSKTNEVKSLILKLYEPLENKFQPNQQLWVSKIQSVPVLNQIVLIDDVVDSCTLLKPNFNLDIGDDIGYQILDDLIASGSVSSTELIEEYLDTNGFSLNSLDLNYISGSEYNWTEFVKYSSAAERVENFFYKVKTIEFHNNTYDILLTTSGSLNAISVSNEITRVLEKISNIKKGFDAFEKLLYTESNALTYPGAGGSALSGSTSNDTQNWYIDIIGSARTYDKYNKNQLVNNIPAHIVTEGQGQDFILFFNMIGQHFDVIWSYIKGVSKSKQLTHNYDEGMTNDLIYHMLESLGWDADMGVKSQFLWEYAFGKNKDGSSSSIMTGKERQQEIWRRLLNNLPYLYKHKGTKRALTAAMACYGIPTSMLTIMEFGGPVDPNAGGVTSFTFDDRTAAIVFDGAASVEVPWDIITSTSDYPQSIEMRINTELRQNHTLLTGAGFDLQLMTESISGSLAYLQLTVGSYSGSTTWFPVFNDEYTQIVVNRSLSGGNAVYDIYGKEGFNERIRNEGYGQLLVPTGSDTWDYVGPLEVGFGFTGSMDEFRLWTAPLNESRIENHTLLPDAIDGNHVSASTEDLIFRLDFEYPKDRNADPYIKNVSVNRSYGNGYATGSNFSSVTEYPYQYIPYERTVTAKVPSTGIGFSNKVRFESQTLENYLAFGTTSNVSSFENANDSSKLGLFFSPIREVNMDILRSLGQFNIDNYIGNPADDYNEKYSELDTLRNYYFQRFELNIYEYIQLVRYIDQTLFTTLESLVPGRAKVSTGLLIEPHLLERSKLQHIKPIAEELSHETVITVDEYSTQTASNEGKDAVLDTIEDISLVSTNPQYDGVLELETDIPLIGETPFYDGSIFIDEEEITLDGEHILYEMDIDAELGAAIIGEYYGIQFQQVGMDIDGIDSAGFGIWGTDGNTIRTSINKDGHKIQERLKVYRVQESNVVNIPENINPLDSSLGTNLVPTTFYKYKVTFLNFDQTAPLVNGNITEVIPLEGYFPSHFRYSGDASTGMERSFYNGSKQTDLTTLDGGPAWETFTTNPNTLKVSDTGRGSGEPILQVD